MVIAPPTPPTLARPPGRRYDLIRENAFGFEANFTVVGQAINANKTGTCRDTCQSAPLETMTHALWGRGGEGEVGGGGTRDERRTSFTSVAAQRENHLHRPASRRSDTAASRFKDHRWRRITRRPNATNRPGSESDESKGNEDAKLLLVRKRPVTQEAASDTLGLLHWQQI